MIDWHEKKRRVRRGRSAQILACAALMAALLVPTGAAARGSDGYWIQVFALAGPMCPVAIEGEECPDALAPGVEFVLQKRHRRVWEEVARFETNALGYAYLWVENRGSYRVDFPHDPPSGISVAPLPYLESPVMFRVPARHRTADGFQLTPVVVNLDTGIR